MGVAKTSPYCQVHDQGRDIPPGPAGAAKATGAPGLRRGAHTEAFK